MNMTQAELRSAFTQAHASSRIEGHIPDPLYLADCEAVIVGTMTMDELRAASLKRARLIVIALGHLLHKCITQVLYLPRALLRRISVSQIAQQLSLPHFDSVACASSLD